MACFFSIAARLASGTSVALMLAACMALWAQSVRGDQNLFAPAACSPQASCATCAVGNDNGSTTCEDANGLQCGQVNASCASGTDCTNCCCGLTAQLVCKCVNNNGNDPS